MKWTADQESVIDTRDCDLLVSAAAGSGKTAVLVERIMQKITNENDPVDIDALLVVTFTNAAAAQMREKITKALYASLAEDPANEHLARQLSLIHHASITTIDSFCLQVVREHFQVLGLDPGFQIADSAELAALSAEALETVIAEAYAQENPAFLEFVDCYGGDKSDARIEEYIVRVAQKAASYSDPYAWLMQAKEALEITDIEQVEQRSWYQTYVAYLRQMLESVRLDIVYLEELCGIDPGLADFMMTCTMDRQMLESVLDKLQSGRVADMLTARDAVSWVRARSIKKDSVCEELAELVKDSRKKYKAAVDGIIGKIQGLTQESILMEIANVRAHMQVLLELTKQYMTCLDAKKLAEGMLDFSDVEHFALRILRDENGPTRVAKEYQRQYHEIMIDEYQDSNFLQEDILCAISGMAKQKHNMFMVGDVKQSIYRFRMARPDLFMHKYESYAREGLQRKIDLKCNFRSRAVVLQAVNDMFYQLMGKDFGGIAYDENAALVPGYPFPEAQTVPVSDSTELLLFDGTAQDREDPEQEEQDKLEQEASMIAQRILTMVGKRGEDPLYVLDEDGEHYRPAQFKDIAILVRSVNVTAPVFLKVFGQYGIPVVSELSSGLMHTQEIQTLLACLEVIHNPYQDIALVSVLHSPMFGFRDERLAQIRVLAEQRKGRMEHFYEAFWSLEDIEPDVRAFADTLCSWQEKSRYMDAASLMWVILKDTQYLLYLQAMDGAQRRLANVHYLIACAMRYGQTGNYRVYDFLQYLSKMKDAQLDMGEAGVHGEHDDIVRIMSMHKSKGLEFPVVFAACLNRQFNLKDAKEDIIIHGDDFLAAHYVDGKRRIRKKTWMHAAFAENMKSEDIAEEFRVLYVAMTRAKEKLILTGYVKDVSAKIDTYGRIAGLEETLLPFGYRRKAVSYMDWIFMSLIRNPEFYEAVTRTLPAAGRMKSCSYVLKKERTAPYHLEVSVVRRSDLAWQDMQAAGQGVLDAGVYLSLQARAKEKKVSGQMLQEQMQFTYAYAATADSKAKYSVSELKAAGGDNRQTQPAQVATVPEFMKSGRERTGADRGTLVHRILYLLEFSDCKTRDAIQSQLLQLREQGMLPEDTLAVVSLKELEAFFASPLGRRMCAANEKKMLYKERQFTMLVSRAQVEGEALHGEDAEQVLVQGIIDAYFEQEDGTLVVVDYKTDRQALPMAQYEKQLQYYAAALERLTHKTVSACYVYWMTKQQSIEVSKTARQSEGEKR